MARLIRTLKNVLLVIPVGNFRDEELFDTKKILESKGIRTTIASTTLSEVTGRLGGKAKPQVLIQNTDIKNYDGILFIGGPGSEQYWDDKTAHLLAQKAYKGNKVVGAICIAPVTLSRAGILKGKKFSVWESEIDTIVKEGGISSGQPVTVDGKIVTGNGPAATKAFAEKVAELL